MMPGKIKQTEELARLCEDLRRMGRRIVFTNGCFDVLHAGHVTLLQEARRHGDFLIVGLNSDASVRRLKGPSRPVHPQAARALVLSALADVDAVCVFDEDTPIPLLEQLRPHLHVKGGDYQPDALPEAETVRRHGGEILIVPLQEGFSSTAALQKMAGQSRVVVAIPARYASVRFPGKPLAILAGEPVIVHVVRGALLTRADRPVLVATDDDRIERAVVAAFADATQVRVVRTSPECRSGTDRLAEAVASWVAVHERDNTIVINLQGDEPFVRPQDVEALAAEMLSDRALQMATLATPLNEPELWRDPNVVKVVRDAEGYALYFSRAPIPHPRDANSAAVPLRHIGIYAYRANWLITMAALAPTPLELAENLEQLRALENGVRIHVTVVEPAHQVSIDTPEDLQRAEDYLARVTEQRRAPGVGENAARPSPG